MFVEPLDRLREKLTESPLGDSVCLFNDVCAVEKEKTDSHVILRVSTCYDVFMTKDSLEMEFIRLKL